MLTFIQSIHNLAFGYPNWHVDMKAFLASLSDYIEANHDELAAARFNASSLASFLSVAFNADGTLKGNAPAGSWWMAETGNLTYIDTSTFEVDDLRSSIYIENRAIKLSQTTPGYAFVESAVESDGKTTVTVYGGSIDSGLNGVEFGQDPSNAPLVMLGRSNEYTAAQSIKPVPLSSDAGNVAWDVKAAQEATFTPTEDSTILTPTNQRDGLWTAIRITGYGSFTVNWSTNFLNGLNLALPSAPPNGKTVQCVFRSNGTNMELMGIREEAS